MSRLSLHRRYHVEVPEEGADHIEHESVEEEESAHEEAQDLGAEDELGGSVLSLLRLVIGAQMVESAEQADEYHQDCHFIDDLGDVQAYESDIFVLVQFVHFFAVEDEMEGPEEGRR